MTSSARFRFVMLIDAVLCLTRGQNKDDPFPYKPMDEVSLESRCGVLPPLEALTLTAANGLWKAMESDGERK